MTRPCRVEALEARQVMSADPLTELLVGAISHHSALDAPLVQHQAALDAPPLIQHADLDLPPLGHHGSTDLLSAEPDFWLDPNDGGSLESQVGQIEQTLASAHLLTGLNTVRANYGFTGAGQTVAVIDSGIAWDHFALGGGLGAGYRVVGGWDFTENDANPYDDGPSGFHGTHVSGIIGADGGVNSGVAPDVDLVGLRVFSDTGAGYFSWVENALRWVHTNRNSFENPITAVNLSLGTNWNASTVPNWANLEDEFAQLEADGIFISVSAGNSFASYNTPGLSYPAASPYVVPVMSVNDAGVLSGFSQRHTRAIAAPGQFITSTVPDYAGNNNGIGDDYASASGTSMAAPYVAGASVIVREAMQFVGMTGITQDKIYDHLIANADTFFDSATNQNYKRLNLGRAIDALMPEDDYGSSVETAYNLGSIGGTLQSQMAMSGVIGKLDDADYFTFTATATGRATFNTSAGTHHFAASWQGMGAAGWSLNAGSGYAMDVVAGQTYTVALSSSGGLGYYGLNVSFESTFSFVDWGAVGAQQTKSNLSTSGEQWYRISASRSGYLTVDAVAGGANVTVDLYNANQQLLAQGGAGDRVDTLATEGQAFYIRVGGTASGVGLRLTNAVGVSGSAVTVTGTAGDDWITFRAGPTLTVAINGVGYGFNASLYRETLIVAGAGQDTVSVYGTPAGENATLSKHSGVVTGEFGSVTVSAAQRINVIGGGGGDVAIFTGTAGNDEFAGYLDRSHLSGVGYFNYVEGFSHTTAISSGGVDIARFYDSAGDDLFESTDAGSRLSGAGFSNGATGFQRVFAYASTGNDTASLGDTAGDDAFTAFVDRSYLAGGATFRYAQGFSSVSAASTRGADSAFFYGTAASESFESSSTQAEFIWSSMRAVATGFTRAYAMGEGGYDTATLIGDADYVDIFTSFSNRAYLSHGAYLSWVGGFEEVRGVAVGAGDLAFLNGTSLDETVIATPTYTEMTGAGFERRVEGFAKVSNNSGGGNDTIDFYDSAGDDVFNARRAGAHMSGVGFLNVAAGFARVRAFSDIGNDLAVLNDWTGADALVVGGDRASLSGPGFTIESQGFGKVVARGENGGANTAALSAFDGVFQLLGEWT